METQSPVLSFFLELAAIPSPPGEERAVADAVLRYLRELGLEPDEDDCGPAIGSTMGNIYARLEPTADGTPLFFCAHLDTVPPSGPLEPVVDGRRRAERGRHDPRRRQQVGGRRDARGRAARARREPPARRHRAALHAEGGGRPDRRVRVRPRRGCTRELGYVYDQAAPIGEIILGAPWSQSMEVRFHGRAAHAGMFPEEGRSAIQAAAKAIADLRLGRVDEETTANVGVISGGTGGNIVPEWCTFLAEARSQDERKLTELVQEMLDAFSFAATATDCEVETTMREELPRLPLQAGRRRSCGSRRPRSSAAATRRRTRCRAAAPTRTSSTSAGGSCVNLANGMTDIHTPDERIAVEDLDAMVDVTLALVDAARA